jgi:hypothetical protein
MLPSFGKGTHDACAIAAFFRSMLCLHHTPIGLSFGRNSRAELGKYVLGMTANAMVRSCSRPASQRSWQRRTKSQGARHVTQGQFHNHRNRYWQELISRGRSRQARRDHASTEVVAPAGGSTAGQLPPCLIGMEACVGAHQYVRPYSKRRRMTSTAPRRSPSRCSARS